MPEMASHHSPLPRNRIVPSLLILCIALLGSNCQEAQAPTAKRANELTPTQVLQHLKELIGDWQATRKNGQTVRVSYRLVARDTVLVESWLPGTGRETLTLYHMDKDDLLATHYCALGNQPRLRLRVPSTAGVFAFDFVSATNLPDAKAAHQQRFEIRIRNADCVVRSETYVDHGKGESEEIVFRRLK
jgi:hypothetical protein